MFFYVGIHKAFKKSTYKNEKKYKVSVVVSARNEEENILNLLDSLEAQTYPKDLFELIICDDRSTDSTRDIIGNFAKHSSIDINFIMIDENGTAAGKKQALNKIIPLAKNDILMFTDCDCVVSSKWIETYVEAYDDDTDYVLGVVNTVYPGNAYFSKFRTVEAIVYRLLSCVGLGNNFPITSSASNMSYRKKLFFKGNGFGRFLNVRSGDDDLQMFNLWKFLNKKKYLFSQTASVTAYEKKSKAKHVNLATRRASKFIYYPNSLKVLTLLVFLYFVVMVIFTGHIIIDHNFLKSYGILLIIKLIFEFSVVAKFCTLINREDLIKHAIFFVLSYPFSFIFFGFKGTLCKYKWKE